MQKDPEKDSLLAHVLADRRYAAMLGLGFSAGIPYTGTFRLGGNELLFDSRGKSWISMEDFAIAMVDELEHPKHSRRRFTVGY